MSGQPCPDNHSWHPEYKCLTKFAKLAPQHIQDGIASRVVNQVSRKNEPVINQLHSEATYSAQEDTRHTGQVGKTNSKLVRRVKTAQKRMGKYEAREV